MQTNGDFWRGVSEQREIPFRTLAQVKAALELAAMSGAGKSMARLMLRHGRLTDEARAHVAREYPQR